MTPSFKTFITSTVLVLASATAFSALAQTPTTPAAPTQGARTPGKGLKELDVNKDKMLSRDEVKGRPHLTQNFDAIDTNKDGQLSRDEMKAYRQAHKGQGQSQGQAKSKP
jgi:hypothetical protein